MSSNVCNNLEIILIIFKIIDWFKGRKKYTNRAWYEILYL